MKRITQRQREVLQYIQTYTDRHGYPPCHRDIGSELGGLSTNAVNDHLVALERKGFITRTPRIARGLAITPLGIEQL